MAYTLPELPYAKDALAPVISAETIEYHYGKHHQGYVNKLNGMVPGTPYEGKSLEDVVKSSHGKPSEQAVFNNAGQVWNHNFYWNCLSPSGGGEPSGELADALSKSFGSVADFKAKFSAEAAARFGSGWAWLVKTDSGLAIETTLNADTPMARGTQCLLTFDVWEHAYYIDYRNARPKYLEELWKVVNWDFVAKQLA